LTQIAVVFVPMPAAPALPQGPPAPTPPPAEPPRAKTVVAEPEPEPERWKPSVLRQEPEPDQELDLELEPELEPELELEDEEAPPELPFDPKPSWLERGLALVQVGAELMGAVTQYAVQETAKDIENTMRKRQEHEKRQYHLVAVLKSQHQEFLYVSGLEADQIEKRLRREGWHVLRTPL